MRTTARVFVALWYLLGWLFHVYLALSSPTTYAVFGETGLLPGFPDFWQNTVMPNIVLLASLLAGFELTVGILLISRDPFVKPGLVLSLAFNLFLVQMGLGFPAADATQDILANRLPNLMFVAIQVPLLWGTYKESLVTLIRRRFGVVQAKSAG